MLDKVRAILVNLRQFLHGDLSAVDIENQDIQRRIVVMNFTILIAFVIAWIWFIFEILIRQRPVPLIIQVFGITGALVFLYWQKRAKPETTTTVFVAAFCTALIALTLFLNLSNPTIFWLFIIPPVAYFIGGEKNGKLWSIGVTALFIMLSILSYFGYFGIDRDIVFIVDFLSAFVLVAAFVFFYERTRRSVQDNLTSAYVRNQTVLNTVKDGIIVIDENSEVQTLNTGAENILGWLEYDVSNQPLHKILTTDEIPTLTNIDQHINIDNVESITKNGSFLNLRLQISPLDVPDHARQGKHQLYIITIQDKTEEKQLERMKLDFVAIAAHELRTPVTALRGYMELVDREITPTLDPAKRHNLERLHASIDNLSLLSEDLLSVSNIEKGAFTIRREKTDWPALVESVIAEYQPNAEKKSLKLTYVPGSNLPPADIDPQRMREVLTNIVSNAISYTENGSITITTFVDDTKDNIITHVQDTGVGIPESAQDHVFDKFFKATSVLQSNTKGSGLGLYIAKNIVELHGGKIWFESASGKGSTFSFTVKTRI